MARNGIELRLIDVSFGRLIDVNVLETQLPLYMYVVSRSKYSTNHDDK